MNDITEGDGGIVDKVMERRIGQTSIRRFESHHVPS
ncbi:hypothetical protein E2C01_091266 [Portunus trituberculatus]|uniref:Uncharacterized protein n=1 Tax=Portunus trituberculatus TaxID=210409 RepID=A0A5B7JH26_PORTR|nr:hypothetical protein [Portunus trituberculatus]